MPTQQRANIICILLCFFIQENNTINYYLLCTLLANSVAINFTLLFLFVFVYFRFERCALHVRQTPLPNYFNRETVQLEKECVSVPFIMILQRVRFFYYLSNH